MTDFGFPSPSDYADWVPTDFEPAQPRGDPARSLGYDESEIVHPWWFRLFVWMMRLAA